MHCGSNSSRILKKLGGLRDNLSKGRELEGGGSFSDPEPSPLYPRMIWICSICFALGMD